ncbi:MAG: hypothetical protein NVSMB17_05160 [Candidatus Dormibacteria bacterium]
MARSPLFLGSSTESERAMRAAVVRIGLGAVMLLAPGLGRKIFGVPNDQDNGSVRLLARLFGIRQVILGAWTLQVQDSSVESRRLCYQLNAATDGVDIVALAIAGVTGKGLVQAAVMGSLLGTSETLAWLDLLQQLDDASTEGEGVSLA